MVYKFPMLICLHSFLELFPKNLSSLVRTDFRLDELTENLRSVWKIIDFMYIIEKKSGCKNI